MSLAIEEIQVIGDELAIRWNDQEESFISLEHLRRHCPCASCQGEGDLLHPAQAPEPNHSPESFQMRSWNFAGGYAFQPTWQDGHSTGLFSFQLLRQLASTPAS